ncbi:hypothetical protein SAMN05216490_1358 [Mucilaginibacter mallensis]|uniref:Uncharacterized protein n=1 Tax=Mucilaginibacter mallensis TaxID=652787 RepID=A0A1H1T3R6_MUCMA|nr:hypothetical protein [Mucilaginibacter mallensis]SDS54872.1 hypothetical protein SAMN05216490_1358 [Mucilaginibacter mallensis]
MDSFETQLDKAQLSSDNFSAETFIPGLFKPGSDPYDKLKHAIEREFRPNGAPEVIQMDIDRVKYEPTSGKGNFRVVLDINYTFGCEDLLIKKNEQTSEWTFFIDQQLLCIFFDGSPYIDSRSTADEF